MMDFLYSVVLIATTIGVWNIATALYECAAALGRIASVYERAEIDLDTEHGVHG